MDDPLTPPGDVPIALRIELIQRKTIEHDLRFNHVEEKIAVLQDDQNKCVNQHRRWDDQYHKVDNQHSEILRVNEQILEVLHKQESFNIKQEEINRQQCDINRKQQENNDKQLAINTELLRYTKIMADTMTTGSTLKKIFGWFIGACAGLTVMIVLYNQLRGLIP